MTYKERIDRIKAEIAKFTDLTAPAIPVVAPAVPAVPDATAAKEYVLADGVTKVKLDKLEMGGVVQMMDASGNLTPCAPGTLTLSDGTSITVGDAGVITTVTPPTAAAAAPAIPVAMATQEDRQKFSETVTAKFGAGSIEERLANIEAMMPALMGYCFSWDIAQAAKNAAIDVYNNSGLAQQTADMQKTTQDFSAQIEGKLTATQTQMLTFAKLVSEALEGIGGKPAAESLEATKNVFAEARETTKKKETVLDRMMAKKEAAAAK